MKGRSSDQAAEYEDKLDLLIDVLRVSPMSVREILNALGRKREFRPAAATVYSRLKVLLDRGDIVSSKRQEKIAGKSGQREYVYSVKNRRKRS